MHVFVSSPNACTSKQARDTHNSAFILPVFDCFCKDDPCYTGWSDSFWRDIGLGDLVDEDYSRIGNNLYTCIIFWRTCTCFGVHVHVLAYMYMFWRTCTCLANMLIFWHTYTCTCVYYYLWWLFSGYMYMYMSINNTCIAYTVIVCNYE